MLFRSQETIDRNIEVGQVNASQINLGGGLELSNTCRHDSIDLDHNAGDSIGGARVTF